MAIPQQPLGPVPNVRLRDNPTEDAIWKRWFEALRNRTTLENQIDHNLLLGLQGGTTDEYYHLTAAQHTAIGSLGTFGNNQVVYTNGSGALTTEAAFGYDQSTNTLSVDNAVLGSSSSNTLTINSRTWTIGSNYTATRAIGVAAAGISNPQSWTTTFTGDAGGTTDVRGATYTTESSGSVAITNNFALAQTARHSGTANITGALRALVALTTVTGIGNVAITGGFSSSLTLTSSGSITSSHSGFLVNPPSITSTGTIATFNGLQIANIGNAAITTSQGILISDITGSTNIRGINLSISAGVGKFNILASGSADNAFTGKVRIGSTVAPTVALDVTGAFAVSTTATIGTVCQPDANDGAALGTTALQWSDLFLASGAVIDFANGNAVITHSSGIITVSTGDLRVTTAGTNAASAVTVGGTQTLSNKTLDTTIISDAANLVLNTSTGTKIGTATNQKLGFWNATPIVQPSSTGETAGFTAGAGTNVTDESTFTGNVGSTAYRISDIVKHLKNEGLLAA